MHYLRCHVYNVSCNRIFINQSQSSIQTNCIQSKRKSSCPPSTRPYQQIKIWSSVPLERLMHSTSLNFHDRSRGNGEDVNQFLEELKALKKRRMTDFWIPQSISKLISHSKQKFISFSFYKIIEWQSFTKMLIVNRAFSLQTCDVVRSMVLNFSRRFNSSSRSRFIFFNSLNGFRGTLN